MGWSDFERTSISILSETLRQTKKTQGPWQMSRPETIGTADTVQTFVQTKLKTLHRFHTTWDLQRSTENAKKKKKIFWISTLCLRVCWIKGRKREEYWGWWTQKISIFCHSETPILYRDSEAYETQNLGLPSTDDWMRIYKRVAYLVYSETVGYFHTDQPSTDVIKL